jgi:hypothetical protein
MTTSASFLDSLEDELTCAICLGPLTYPQHNNHINKHNNNNNELTTINKGVYGDSVWTFLLQ